MNGPFFEELESVSGKDMVLQSVSVAVRFTNLFCETSLTQVYQNQEESPLEAVYTFPLPLKAVLLDLKVCIGERILQAEVVEILCRGAV